MMSAEGAPALKALTGAEEVTGWEGKSELKTREMETVCLQMAISCRLSLGNSNHSWEQGS